MIYNSVHNIPDGQFTGSTVEKMIDNAVKLGRTHFVYTGDGYVSEMYKGYKYIKNNKLEINFVPGIILYFKDNDCSIIKGTTAERVKYYQITVYFKTQTAFEIYTKLTANSRRQVINIIDHDVQLFTWDDLKKFNSDDITFVLGGLHCIVGKNILINAPEVADQYDRKIRRINKNTYYAIQTADFDQFYQDSVILEFEDKKVIKLQGSDHVITDKTGFRKNFTAKDVGKSRKGYHTTIKGVTIDKIYYPINKNLVKSKIESSFMSVGNDPLQIINQYHTKNSVSRLLLSDWAYFETDEKKTVQNVKLSGEYEFHHSFKQQSFREAATYIKNKNIIDISNFKSLLNNNTIFCNQFNDFKLEFKPVLPKMDEKWGGDNTLALVSTMRSVGRMKWNDPIYMDRFKYELEALRDNGYIDLIPYFFPFIKIRQELDKLGHIDSPLRGSAGGSLITYCLGITNVDPVKYKLSFDRFFSKTRASLGDIPDIDLDYRTRKPLVEKNGILDKYWKGVWSQVSTRSLMRLKSSIKDVSRVLHGKVPKEVEKLTKALEAAPQGMNDQDFIFGYDKDGSHVQGYLEQSKELQDYVAEHKKEWDIVVQCLGVHRGIGRHASAFIIYDQDITNKIPVMTVNNTDHVSQFEAPEMEAAGAIKYDFLVIKVLEDLELAINIINKKKNYTGLPGHLIHDEGDLYIWDLPQNCPKTSKLASNGELSSAFQVSTETMRPYVMAMMPTNVLDYAALVALVRPGPMGYKLENKKSITEEYISRKNGGHFNKTAMSNLLPDTYGLPIYQENLSMISKELGGMSPDDAEKLRKVMSKKKTTEMMKMKPQFMENAITKLSEDESEGVWSMMEEFAKYSFNFSHSTGYSHVTYATLWLKANYPLEWWSAVLTNASDKEIIEKFWKDVKDLVLPPDINLSSETIAIDYDNHKLRSKLSMLAGLGVKTADKIIAHKPYKSLEDFIEKKPCGEKLMYKLCVVGVLDSLFTDKSLDLLQKLQQLSNIVSIQEYKNKISDRIDKIDLKQSLKNIVIEAKQYKETKRLKMPKPGNVPVEYIGLNEIQELKTKKSIFPTMPVDLSGVIKRNMPKDKISMVCDGDTIFVKSKFEAINEYLGRDPVPLMDGETLTKMINIDATTKFAVPGYVVDTKEFSYQNGSKIALKVTFDSDNFITELVLWPDYNSGELRYPPGLEKGAVCMFFLSKKEGKPQYTNIYDIVVLE